MSNQLPAARIKDDHLTLLENLLRDATPLPWSVDVDDDIDTDEVMLVMKGDRSVAIATMGQSDDQGKLDAAFIASITKAAASLIEEVREHRRGKVERDTLMVQRERVLAYVGEAIEAGAIVGLKSTALRNVRDLLTGGAQ